MANDNSHPVEVSESRLRIFKKLYTSHDSILTLQNNRTIYLLVSLPNSLHSINRRKIRNYLHSNTPFQREKERERERERERAKTEKEDWQRYRSPAFVCITCLLLTADIFSHSLSRLRAVHPPSFPRSSSLSAGVEPRRTRNWRREEEGIIYHGAGLSIRAALIR